jgi:transposase InsO family protein
MRAIGKLIKTYNEKRKQQKLGWLSPAEFEKQISKMDQRPERKLFNFTKVKNGF